MAVALVTIAFVLMAVALVTTTHVVTIAFALMAVASVAVVLVATVGCFGRRGGRSVCAISYRRGIVFLVVALVIVANTIVEVVWVATAASHRRLSPLRSHFPFARSCARETLDITPRSRCRPSSPPTAARVLSM